jgi:hypothetical protein
MRTAAGVFTIALALGTIALAPGAGAREPIKIKACQTISQGGSYEVADNLVNGAGFTCLVITASDVTIDLAGFVIIADTRRGEAIVAVPPTSERLFGLAVRNGSIQGRVDLSSADGSIVEGLRVRGDPFGIGTGITASGIVKGNTVGGGGPIAFRYRDFRHGDGDRQLRSQQWHRD